MYTAFFGLREKPFALSPDPRFLFLSAAHREALAHLLYGIEQGEGFIAVTGEVGTGKTTLCRTLLRRLGPEVEVAFLFNPKLSARELLEAILVELGLEKRGASARELVEELNHFLLERRQQGRRVLLIIDEAQGLAPDTLEQIRLLSNLETETQKLIQILLLGQPELDVMLESEELRQLRQRIAVRWRLAPLSREETQEYVRHRLRVSAGGDRDHLFAEPALRDIFRRSQGVPRVVNLLCDRALLSAFAEGAPQIGRVHVERAARETGAGIPVELAGRRRSYRLLLPLAAAVALGVAAAGAWRLAQQATGGNGTSAPPRADAAPAVDPALPGVASEAPSVSAPPPVIPVAAPALPGPLVASEAAAVQPPAPVAPGPARVDDLGHALALRAPGVVAGEALDAMLEAWSVDGSTAQGSVLAFPDLIDALAAHGLGVISVPDADVAHLRAIAHPALVVAMAADGLPRTVALQRVEGDEVELAGVVEGGSARVPAAELERVWSGESYVVWREFEALPEVLRPGDAGESVAWLQGALIELGFAPGPASGVFDAATEAAVRAFQSDRALEVDGEVGPLTKMSLYRALGRYGAPELAAVGKGPG
jgi:general secretion pathway protein A